MRLAAVLVVGWMLAGLPVGAIAQFRVETTIPAQGATGVDRHKGVALFFNRAPDRSTLARDAILVTGSVSGRIDTELTFTDSLIALISPMTPFAEGEAVRVRLGPGIRSVEGDSLGAGGFELLFHIETAEGLGKVDEDASPDTVRASNADGGETASRSIQAPRYFFSSDDDPDLAYEVLLGKAEDLIAGRFGVDVMEVSSIKVGSRNATAVRTGWFLNPRTQVAIVNEIRGSTPRTRFLLEYRLSDQLQLVLTQGGDRGEGIDLVWSREY